MALLEFASPSYAVLEREQRVTVEVVRYGNTNSVIHFRYVGDCCPLGVRSFVCVQVSITLLDIFACLHEYILLACLPVLS